MADAILQRLGTARDGILLAEVGAYLHMIGKLSNDFLVCECREGPKGFDYQKVCDDASFLGDRFRNVMTGDRIGPRLVLPGMPANARTPSSLCAFIEQHTNRSVPEPVLRFLVDAHGIVSGVEKNLPVLLPSHLTQRRDQTWRATAFGFEEENLAPTGLDALRKGVLDKVAGLLETVRDGSPLDWASIFLGDGGFRALLEPVMSRALGDTRRPVNEVTLWDQSYMTAALLKSSLAQVVLENGYRDPLASPKPTWRLLSVALDRWHFVRKAVRLGDADGYQQAIDAAFSAVKRLIEIEVPLGCEIYRDTSGIFFTFPGLEDGLRDEIINGLGPQILRVCHDVDPELAPRVFTTGVSRSVVVQATAIRDAKDATAHPYRTSTTSAELRSTWKDITDACEVCPVCHLRPMAEQGEACRYCRRRRVGRATEWLANPSRTIWLDEVADAQDRCALIVARFDLDRWLDGTATESLRSLTVPEFLTEWNAKHQGDDIRDYAQLIACITADLRSNTASSALLKALHPGYRYAGGAQSFYEILVEERDVSGVAASIAADDWATKARLLALFLFRKYPSPARLRRFWETTARFFDKNVARLLDDRLTVGAGRERLSFEIAWTGGEPDLEPGAAFDIVVAGVQLSPVWDGSRFISTWNHGSLPEAWRSAGGGMVAALQGKPVGADKKGPKLEGSIRGVAVLRGDIANYASWIPMLMSPDQFVAAVPADRALRLAREIFGEYAVQFSKIRDRLALHLGILTFDRRLPLYVALDAASRVLDSAPAASAEVGASVLEVGDADTASGNRLGAAGTGDAATRLCLKVEKGRFTGEQFEWRVSRSTGDPEVEDRWTANVCVDEEPTGRAGAFQAADGRWFAPVGELQQGDRIRFRPSVVTLHHVGTAAARFAAGQRWLAAEALDRIATIGAVLDKGLRTRQWSVRQVRALRDLVEERRQRWGDVPQEFVDACIVRHLGLDPASERGALLRAALADGMFAVSFVWNFDISRAEGYVENAERRGVHAETV